MVNVFVIAEVKSYVFNPTISHCCNFCSNYPQLHTHPAYREGTAYPGWEYVKECPITNGFVVGDKDGLLVSFANCTDFNLTHDTAQLIDAITKLGPDGKKMDVITYD